MSMALECECAESWVESNRQVIKVLMNAERRLQKDSSRDPLQLRYWTESPGATAAWIYDSIFSNVLHSQTAEHRRTARSGRVRTVRTTDGNGTASDSEQEDDTGSIPPDIERLLDESPVRSRVINELLERWTGHSFKEIRQIAESNGKSRSRLQDTARRVIKWWKIDNDRNGGTGSSSRKSDVRKVENTTSPTVEAPTPPGTPKLPSSQSAVPQQGSNNTKDHGKSVEDDWGDGWGVSIGSNKGKKRHTGRRGMSTQRSIDDISKAFVFGGSQVPSFTTTEHVNGAGSSSRFGTTVQSPGATSSIMGQFGDDEPNPWLESTSGVEQSSKDAEFSVEEISELDLNSENVKGKAPVHGSNKASSADVVLSKSSDSSTNKPIIIRRGMDETQTVGGQQVRITVNAVDQQTHRKSTLSRQSGSDSNPRHSQGAKKHSNHQNTSKVEFLEPDLERSSDRRSRDQRAPTRESSRSRRDEENVPRVPARRNTQSVRSLSANLFPEPTVPQNGALLSSYSTSTLLPPGLLPHLSYPAASGLIGPYMAPYANQYPVSFFEQSGPSSEKKDPNYMELLRRLDELVENNEARKTAEAVRREDGLIKAQGTTIVMVVCTMWLSFWALGLESCALGTGCIFS